MTFDHIIGDTESQIIGIMLKHADGDREYYTPDFSADDTKTIFNILDKYGDNNESMRGCLEIVETDPQPVKTCDNCPRFYDCDNSGYYETCEKNNKNVVKYNYKGAAALWDEYYNLCCDPWDLCGIDIQQERRYFMRAVTRHIDIKVYIDHIYGLIDDARPVDGVKSRCFDFEYERQLENIIYKIKTFSNN